MNRTVVECAFPLNVAKRLTTKTTERCISSMNSAVQYQYGTEVPVWYRTAVQQHSNAGQHNTPQTSQHHPTSPHPKPYHTTPRHATPRHTTPHHATPRHTTPHHTTPHHTTPHHTTPHHATPHHTTPHHTTPHRTTRHPATPNHITPPEVSFGGSFASGGRTSFEKTRKRSPSLKSENVKSKWKEHFGTTWSLL